MLTNIRKYKYTIRAWHHCKTVKCPGSIRYPGKLFETKKTKKKNKCPRAGYIVQTSSCYVIHSSQACVLPRRLQEIVTISVFGNKIPLVKLDNATTKFGYGGFNSWNFLVRS